MTLSEKELIQKSRAGDKKAFEQLVNLYFPRIRRLSQRVCKGLPSEAEDVFQDAFVKALENIKNFKGKSDFGTWLYRIASNLCWKKFREKKRKSTVSLSFSEEWHKSLGIPERSFADYRAKPDFMSEKKELKQMIAHALKALPPAYRTVLLVSDLNDWSNAKIAKELNLSVSAVKSRLHRARAILKGAILTYKK